MLYKIVFPDVVFKGPPAPDSPDGVLVDITPCAELIGLVSAVPPKGQQGFTIKDIRERLKLLDQLEAAKDWVVLDQPEYVLLRSVVEASVWARVNSSAMRLVDAVDQAEEIDPVEAVSEE